MAIAVRLPDGSIRVEAAPLGGRLRRWLGRIPLVRGILTLVETLISGVRALTWSAAVTAAGSDEPPGGRDAVTPGLGGWLTALLMLVVASLVFFVVPALVLVWPGDRLPRWALAIMEGSARLGMLAGYIWGIGRSGEVRRLFQYHGAEHMAIHAFEHGSALQVPAVRRFEREHPRCGTAFLLTLAVLAVAVFAVLGGGPLWWQLTSRVALIPLVAALAYEAVRFAGRHAERPLVRWLFAANLALQRLTTREPDDEQIQVAIAALDRCIVDDRAEQPAP